MTGNDMVVTNLFRVPTITEMMYLQVQFNELDPNFIELSCSFAFIIGLVVPGMVWLLQARLGGENSGRPELADFNAFELRGVQRWIGALTAWTIVSMVALIPIANLIVKAGWIATMENDVIRRSWSLLVVVQSVVQSSTYMNEIGWSIQLSLYSSVLALMLGVVLAACATAKWFQWICIGLMACLLALPGPIVNLIIIKLFDRREPEWISFLADRTLCGPILALQCRCLPVVFGVLWLARERFDIYNKRLLELDLGLPYLTRTWILFKAMVNPIAVAFAMAFFVAFADLSSYLLVQPPQVTTIAMRMFDLLHYGINSRESGLALALVCFGAIPTLLFVRRIDL